MSGRESSDGESSGESSTTIGEVHAAVHLLLRFLGDAQNRWARQYATGSPLLPRLSLFVAYKVLLRTFDLQGIVYDSYTLESLERLANGIELVTGSEEDLKNTGIVKARA